MMINSCLPEITGWLGPALPLVIVGWQSSLRHRALVNSIFFIFQPSLLKFQVNVSDKLITYFFDHQVAVWVASILDFS